MTLNIYRIFTIVLLPFAALFGLDSVLSIFAGFGNPAVMLSAVILACVVIYIFTSAFFLFKGILKNTFCRASLKDWIKVNAVIAIIFAALAIISCISILYLMSNKAMYNQFIEMLNSSRPAGLPPSYSSQELLMAMRSSLIILLPFSIILFIHVLITFRLLKKYSVLFSK
ncbi:hypothetical protein [Hydrotalea sandarakina]|jgi:hypothetical protein|uniref:Uncharacterized protein n=1 Tax=Hydrotalea sandarakina TaxID=1004304 RepID=A0A2W7SCD9_9BACT|nr:hypothetical protein [Hydrotalea sandarakina]PZX64729.1 hypothetical protein LX80_00930 [Hydrotalea sandarakina]